VLVFNKMDALEINQKPLHLTDSYELDGLRRQRVFVSARTGQGLAELRAALAQAAYDNPVNESPDLTTAVS